MRRTKGAFELVDGSDHLAGLKRMPGMQRWKVRDRDNWYTSWEEGKKVRGRVPRLRCMPDWIERCLQLPARRTPLNPHPTRRTHRPLPLPSVFITPPPSLTPPRPSAVRRPLSLCLLTLLPVPPQGFKLDPTMFPDEASDGMPLHLCMRFLPHHQDTGGFFVAVLQKVITRGRGWCCGGGHAWEGPGLE